jgi:hypothetical protein
MKNSIACQGKNEKIEVFENQNITSRLSWIMRPIHEDNCHHENDSRYNKIPVYYGSATRVLHQTPHATFLSLESIQENKYS